MRCNAKSLSPRPFFAWLTNIDDARVAFNANSPQLAPERKTLPTPAVPGAHVFQPTHHLSAGPLDAI
jgi:hypothetical protein